MSRAASSHLEKAGSGSGGSIHSPGGACTRTITLEHTCMTIPHSIVTGKGSKGKGRGCGDNYMILYIAMSLQLLPYQFNHCFGGQGSLHKHNSWGAKPLPSRRGISQPPPPNHGGGASSHVITATVVWQSHPSAIGVCSHGEHCVTLAGVTCPG